LEENMEFKFTIFYDSFVLKTTVSMNSPLQRNFY
jgi:hypothetical protein